MGKLEINYNIKRVIETIELENELVAYKETTFINDKAQGITEGITNKEDLKIELNLPIKNSRFQLYKSEILEFCRKNLYWNILENLNKFSISNPYTYLSENKNAKYILLDFDTCSHLIYDINRNLIPSAIYFDYCTAHIDNEHYDLEESLKILKTRTDIKFLKEGIQKIPYYNQDEDRTECLEFIWMPSDEDYKKINNVLTALNRYNVIAKDIFRLIEK